MRSAVGVRGSIAIFLVLILSYRHVHHRAGLFLASTFPQIVLPIEIPSAS